MAVYVDTLMPCPVSRRWRYPESCHMFADSVGELHVMALSIGLKPEWFQPLSSPHYDLTSSMREKAVKAGAESITLKQAGRKLIEWRRTGAFKGDDDA